jgi:integrase
MPLALHSGYESRPPTTADQRRPANLLDALRRAIRLRHYSRRTEEAYTAWVRRFIVFHGMRHPRDMGATEVTAFLSSLAERCCASTQNQAQSAILFLYEAVPDQQLPWMQEIVRARRPARLPVVLSQDEVSALVGQLHGVIWLMASLMYGSGLRLLETVELRVKDLQFDRGEIVVRDGKGGKDRVTMLPGAVRGSLERHLEGRQHGRADLFVIMKAKTTSARPSRVRVR